MAFQPFGYRFEVVSTSTLAEAKAALRSQKKGWFEPRNGPRGWIIGPLVCLWLSAFDRSGPMLLGWISEHSFGSRVSGRAGSDLNGVLYAALFVPALAFLFYILLSQGGVSTSGMLVAGIVLLLSPMIFWFAHKDRHEAEPLVKFVRRALGQDSPPPRRRQIANPKNYSSMRLDAGGYETEATPDAIHSGVEALERDPSSYLILSQDEERYMQAAAGSDGFVLERRDGSEAQHFMACREGENGKGQFSADEVANALIGYLAGKSEIRGVRWERLFG